MGKVAGLELTQITQAGLRAIGLYTARQAMLDPRLDSGLVDALRDDLTSLGQQVPGAMATHADAMAATAAQNAALAQGYALVSAIRKALSRTGASREVQRAYGVGNKVNAAVVKDVKGAIQQIVDRATAEPDEAATLHILPDDIASLEVDLDAITKADDTQEGKRAGAPLTTKVRDETAGRIVLTVKKIGAAGLIAFARDAAVRAQFEGLLEAVAKKGKGRAATPPVAPLDATAAPAPAGRGKKHRKKR